MESLERFSKSPVVSLTSSQIHFRVNTERGKTHYYFLFFLHFDQWTYFNKTNLPFPATHKELLTSTSYFHDWIFRLGISWVFFFSFWRKCSQWEASVEGKCLVDSNGTQRAFFSPTVPEGDTGIHQLWCRTPGDGAANREKPPSESALVWLFMHTHTETHRQTHMVWSWVLCCWFFLIHYQPYCVSTLCERHPSMNIFEEKKSINLLTRA